MLRLPRRLNLNRETTKEVVNSLREMVANRTRKDGTLSVLKMGEQGPLVNAHTSIFSLLSFKNTRPNNISASASIRISHTSSGLMPSDLSLSANFSALSPSVGTHCPSLVFQRSHCPRTSLYSPCHTPNPKASSSNQ